MTQMTQDPTASNLIQLYNVSLLRKCIDIFANVKFDSIVAIHDPIQSTIRKRANQILDLICYLTTVV